MGSKKSDPGRQRVWQVRGPRLDAVTSTETLESLLLAQRGVAGDAAKFFMPTYEQDIHDPYELHGMKTAVTMIRDVVARGGHILVYGDYDADGVTSTALLTDVLQRLHARVTPFLPHRLEHGYGLNATVLESLAHEVDLVITVDCGVANAAEINWLVEHGVQVIVIDHHSLPLELPQAGAVVHPAHPAGQYPFASLCGVGVTWKVATALLREVPSPSRDDAEYEKWLLDLVAIGTIADVVPLLGENRALVTFGLEVLRRTRRVGLQVLLSALRLPREQLSAKDVGWKIVPLINAAGRVDHPQPALDLLLARTQAAALEAVTRLQQLNLLRQTLARQMVAEAEAQVVTQAEAPFIFAHNIAWSAGVVGLVANKLATTYARPAIVVGGNGRHAVGSARSPITSNVLQLLGAGKDVYTAWGGHAQAAGFSLATERIEELREVLALAHQTTSTDVEAIEEADAVVAETLLSVETVRLIRQFAPFGQGNEYPRLIVRNLRLLEWRPVGKAATHAKFTFDAGGRRIEGIGFGLAGHAERLESGAVVDVLGELEEDEWRGRWRLQLAVRDIAPAGTVHIRSHADDILVVER